MVRDEPEGVRLLWWVLVLAPPALARLPVLASPVMLLREFLWFILCKDLRLPPSRSWLPSWWPKRLKRPESRGDPVGRAPLSSPSSSSPAA